MKIPHNDEVKQDTDEMSIDETVILDNCIEIKVDVNLEECDSESNLVGWYKKRTIKDGIEIPKMENSDETNNTKCEGESLRRLCSQSERR